VPAARPSFGINGLKQSAAVHRPCPSVIVSYSRKRAQWLGQDGSKFGHRTLNIVVTSKHGYLPSRKNKNTQKNRLGKQERLNPTAHSMILCMVS
jgi:hypothetical protein